jgi:hypothetical protein
LVVLVVERKLGPFGRAPRRLHNRSGNHCTTLSEFGSLLSVFSDTQQKSSFLNAKQKKLSVKENTR